ncbi:frizzled-4-like [Coccinella septempunctata]|uniref:frizzled-4-like n=1 Tax=Coccinella septempunctata TaxID=41139 RepID=UPI001D0655DB|nr:frizzled-4-like [Coccinella septempunctata]
MFWLFLVLVTGATAEPLRTCEPIRIDLCSGLGYNMTGMPNLGGNDQQHEADYTLKSFSPLIQYGCSSQLKLFLCSVYVPMCTEKVANPIGPCRGLCESVRSRCYPVLRGFGFPWPEALNCSRFPVENNHEHMCMEGPKDKGIDVTASVDPAVQKFNCAPQFTRNEFGGCVPTCEANSLFEEHEKRFAEVWVSLWALICFVTSFGSGLTLIIGGGRARAPPLVSMALCYCLISIGWALRMFSGRMTGGCQNGEGLDNVNCSFVFLLIYYFGMASKAWWGCLCAWWVARVGLQWTTEKMRSLETILHVCAWGFPAGQTVVALVRRDVDADDLTGTCYVGNKNSDTLLSLVLIPDIAYFAVGIILLIFGCICVIRRPAQSAAAPLTAAAPRKESDFLGAICTLYAIPTFCVMATVYYEYNERYLWVSGRAKPALWAFLIRYLMSLFVGVSTVFWIWSFKTITAWRSVLKKLGPKQQPPLKVPTLPVLRYVPPPQNSVSGTLSTGSRHSIRAHPHRKPRLHHLKGPGGETII